jgi:formylglycine-generating enzyme required for sulfatase activity
VGDVLGRVGDPRLHDAEASKVFIPRGTYWMGAQRTELGRCNHEEDASSNESPVHQVQVSPFRVGRYPVTVQEFENFIAASERGYLDPSCWRSEGWAWRQSHLRFAPSGWEEQTPFRNRPVVGVSWYEADAYARWVRGRLPTEAEWEWVARGADGLKYPWGDEPPTNQHANFLNRVHAPSPVGIYPADSHKLGVRDLAGNVWEWCADYFDTYDRGYATDPTGPERGSSRVLRGGSFDVAAHNLRGAYRFSYLPERGFANFGFRVVWSVAGGHP